MNIDLSGFEHEIVSTLIGGVVSVIWHKALRVAKDINCLWERFRIMEEKIKQLEEKK